MPKRLLTLPLFLACVVAQDSSEPVTPDQAYFDGLRARKLYRLIEVHCRRQLARPNLEPAEEARFTIELADTLASRAQQAASASQRSKLWEEAARHIGQLLTRTPDHPQAAVLRFQLGVYELAQAQILAQQVSIAPSDQNLQTETRKRFAAAAVALRAVDDEVMRSLNRSPSKDSDASARQSRQLRLLSENARFRLAQALTLAAQTYPRQLPAFRETAQQAKTQLDALTQRYHPSEIVIESYLYKADVLRMLGEFTEAEKLLREIEQRQPAARYLDRALVIRSQVLLDRKNGAAARALIEDSRKLLQAPIPDLELLYVHATLEVAQAKLQARDPLAARELVSHALAAIDEIGKQHGAYWMARCEILLGELASAKSLVDDPRVLARVAEGQVRRADLTGAIATLDHAREMAAERNELDAAMDLGIRAAVVVQQSGDLARASERFAQLAITYSNRRRAGEAQFLAIYCVGRSYAASPAPALRDEYDRLLSRFVQLYASDANVPEARWLLAALRITQRRWTDAIELLDAVPTTHGRHKSAQHEIARCYEEWLRDLSLREQPMQVVADAALRFAQSTASRPDLRAPSGGDVALALRLVRILLHPAINRPREADSLLRAVQSSAASPPERSEHRRLRVSTLVSVGKFADARQLIEQELGAEPAELLAIVRLLDADAARSSETRRAEIGRLQTLAAERLAKLADRLTGDQKVEAALSLALAHVNAGESVRAQELFDQLRKQLPNNPRVLKAQAENLLRLGRYSQARELWSELASRVTQNSPDYFHAKYNLALACLRSGDAAQAKKIIGVLEVLHPELGGPEQKARFDQLKTDAAKP